MPAAGCACVQPCLAWTYHPLPCVHCLPPCPSYPPTTPQSIDVEDYWVFEHALKKSPANRWRLAGRLSILPSAVEQKQAGGEQAAAEAAAAQQVAGEPAAAVEPVTRMGHVAQQQRPAAQSAAGQRQKQKAAAGRGRR